MCVHALVCKCLSLRYEQSLYMACFAVCLQFVTRPHSVWGNCTVTLCFVLCGCLFLSSVFFLSFFSLLSTLWMLNWDFCLLVRVTVQALAKRQYISDRGGPAGLPARAALPARRGALRDALGLGSLLLWCFLTAAIVSRRSSEQERISALCSRFWLSCEERSFPAHLVSFWEKQTESAVSQLRVRLRRPSLGRAFALCRGLLWGSRSWVPSRRAWVLWDMVSSGFSALCAGDAVSPQAVSLLPLSQRTVASCPGFGQWSWLLKTWACNGAWRHPELSLGNPKVTLAIEQGRWTLGTHSRFPNGEIRNWLKSPDCTKREIPRSMSSFFPHPAWSFPHCTHGVDMAALVFPSKWAVLPGFLSVDSPYWRNISVCIEVCSWTLVVPFVCLF